MNLVRNIFHSTRWPTQRPTTDKGFILMLAVLVACSVSIQIPVSGKSLLKTSLLNDSTIVINVDGKISGEAEHEIYRTFEGLKFNETAVLKKDPIVIPEITLADSTLEKRNHAHALLEKVLQGQRFLESLDALSEIELPIGVVKSGGAMDYSILIDRINFTPHGAMMEIYVSLELPQSGDRLAFNGKVPLSKAGGITGSAKIYLIGDHHVSLGNSLVTFKGEQNTYVEFNCDGFQGIGLEGIVQFSRDVIVPEDNKGVRMPGNERVKVNFQTYAQSLNDLLLGVNIPPFQLASVEGFGFTVSQAYMDWSDLSNPAAFAFPATYSSPFIEAGSPNLWRGFFLQRLEVRLPPSFAKRNDGKRVSLGVENMILDDQGFTGEIFGDHLIEAGDMSGWAYTLDHLELGLVTNQVTGFHIAGEISVPAIKNMEGQASQFGYVAQRGSDGNYIFNVSMAEQAKLSVWAANVNIYPGSSVTVSEKGNKFYPSANLNGDLSISLTDKGPKTNINGIRFEGMRISSEAPHFGVQSVSYGRAGQRSDVSKFPIVIRNIEVKSEQDRTGLAFDLTINIGGEPDEEGFGGTAALTVWGKEDMTNITSANGVVTGTEKDWAFDKVELSGVGINIAKKGAYSLKGTINFFDSDAVYGEGFSGTLTGSLSAFGGVSATALFGRTNAFRYWYADALVTLKTGVPLVPGALFATGFGGGFYSRMKQTDKSPGSEFGKTESGIYYIPDENTIGIKAIMNIGTARPEAMNGDVGLEVVMNRHGGINSVTLTGNANFMSFAEMGKNKIKELATAGAAGKLSEKLSALMKGQVFGSMKLHFDNVNDVFHGNLEIYVNVAGGLVRGVSPGNKAGWAVLHFEKSDWYVLIGTPDQPIGLEVAKIFQAKSYFMLGQNLPGSPPPPAQVSEILGNVDLDYMRDMNALQSGMGFAFGLHFLVDTGDLGFLMFYGRFAAGTGVDFMLKDYGTQYHCEGSSGPMGINGWYANGQAYAFVMGKIGIRVKLKFYRGKFDILKIGAAAVLQAKGPNPFWMNGIVGGYYSILGGMVKGKCRFEVTVGKNCKPVGEENLLADMQFISEMSPATGSSEVDVFTTPQIAFNIPVEDVFHITDMEERMHFFRAKLDEFVILDGGRRIQGTLEWNDANDVVIFNAFDILPGKKKLTAKAKLTFEEKKNGIWTKVSFDGKIVVETAEVDFTTAQAPDYIPPQNVSLSYPLTGQYNFYPQEYNQGFIQLKVGQPYLFNPGPEWLQRIRLTDQSSNQFMESSIKYSASERRVTFALPQGFANSTVYRFEVVNVPRSNEVIDANITRVEREIPQNEEAGTLTLTTKEIEGQMQQRDIKSLYSNNFRTSKYNTFSEKMSQISLGQTFRDQPARGVFQLLAYMNGDERFDGPEIHGVMDALPLISMEAILPGNAWYQNAVHPLVYEGYPLLGRFTIKKRQNPDLLGIPPVRDIYFTGMENQLPFPSHGEDVTVYPFSGQAVIYNLAASVNQDYSDLQHQVVNYIADNPASVTSRLRLFITEPLPLIRYGEYELKVEYKIPGINRYPSTYTWKLFNRIPDN